LFGRPRFEVNPTPQHNTTINVHVAQRLSVLIDCSDDLIHRTLDAIPDAPAPPYILPYHGVVGTDTVELRWRPPTSFGNGHPHALYEQVYGNETQDWFGMTLPPRAIVREGGKLFTPHEHSNSKAEWGAVPWDELGATRAGMQRETVDMLRGEGWEKVRT
jgi:hypothetical protein